MCGSDSQHLRFNALCAGIFACLFNTGLKASMMLSVTVESHGTSHQARSMQEQNFPSCFFLPCLFPFFAAELLWCECIFPIMFFLCNLLQGHLKKAVSFTKFPLWIRLLNKLWSVYFFLNVYLLPLLFVSFIHGQHSSSILFLFLCDLPNYFLPCIV